MGAVSRESIDTVFIMLDDDGPVLTHLKNLVQACLVQPYDLQFGPGMSCAAIRPTIWSRHVLCSHTTYNLVQACLVQPYDLHFRPDMSCAAI